MNALVDFNEAGKRLSCSPFSLRAWARRGLIHTVKVGRRRLIPATECDRISREGLHTVATNNVSEPQNARPRRFGDRLEEGRNN